MLLYLIYLLPFFSSVLCSIFSFFVCIINSAISLSLGIRIMFADMTFYQLYVHTCTCYFNAYVFISFTFSWIILLLILYANIFLIFTLWQSYKWNVEISLSALFFIQLLLCYSNTWNDRVCYNSALIKLFEELEVARDELLSLLALYSSLFCTWFNFSLQMTM